MKKNKIIFIINIAIISIFIYLVLSINAMVNAAQYAYSIGSKVPTGLNHAGDDFTPNVLTAANAYGWLSNVSSYYSTQPTYSYLTGNNLGGTRLLASHIIFLNGHSNSSLIETAGRNEANYRVGVCTLTNGTTSSDGQYRFAGLQSINMSTCSLITFAGCETGSGTQSLVHTARNRGARVAVGFSQTVNSRNTDGKNWLQTYNYALGSGNSVITALAKACSAYPNSDLCNSIVVMGDENTTLGLPNTSVIKVKANQECLELACNDIEKNFLSLSKSSFDIGNNQLNIHDESLESYKEEFSSIIKEIKEKDKEFDESSYKVTSYLFNSEKGQGIILFRYYINDIIETNKVYMGIIEENKLKGIMLVGIKKDNLEKLNINQEEKVMKVKAFEETKLKRIDSNNTVTDSILNISKDSSSIQSCLKEGYTYKDEKYYFDYNTDELKYVLSVLEDGECNTVDEYSIELKL